MNCRPLRRGTLDLSEADELGISALLGGRPVRITNLVPSAEGEDAIRRSRAIFNKAKENFEERGLSTLYLGCGFAGWDKGQITWTPNAPVLLRPATLRPLGSSQDEFELALAEEMEVNEALLQYLRTQFGCIVDPEKLLRQIDGVIDEPWELRKAFDGSSKRSRRWAASRFGLRLSSRTSHTQSYLWFATSKLRWRFLSSTI